MQVAPPKETVEFAALGALDIRVGTILSVADVEGSRKLVQLQVDLGFAVRTVVVGMKQERENPSEIVGQQALFVVNFAPQVMAGVMSEAMLFDIGYEDKITPVLAQPERSVPNGTRVG